MPKDTMTSRRTTPDDEKILAERTFDLVRDEWAKLTSREELVRALVETARLSSIDERSRAIMRRLSPPMRREEFLVYFMMQLEHDSHHNTAQQTRIVLDSEIEALAKNLWHRLMQSGCLRRTQLIPFFLAHPRGFACEQDCADALLAYISKS
jgi:hypothetical protein